MQRDDERNVIPSPSNVVVITPGRRPWRPRLSRAFLPVLVLGLGVGFEIAQAHSNDDEDVVSGKAHVVKPGVIEVKDHKFHLYGIVNPGGGQSCVRDAKPWNCGEAARTALRHHIEGRKVRCVPDKDDDDIARCTMGDDDLSALLVREGWAKADRETSGKTYADEEKEARHARRGIWADHDNPEEERRQQQRNY